MRVAQHYANLFRVLLCSPAAERLIQPLILFGLAGGHRSFGGDTPAEVAAYHFVTSMRALIRWWLEHDMPYPPEEMAEYVNRLVIRPLTRLDQPREQMVLEQEFQVGTRM